MGAIPKPQIPSSLYLCWRCMKRFEAAPKGKHKCPHEKCKGGIVMKIAEVAGKEKA